jgi:hypothetical protein
MVTMDAIRPTIPQTQVQTMANVSSVPMWLSIYQWTRPGSTGARRTIGVERPTIIPAYPRLPPPSLLAFPRECMYIHGIQKLSTEQVSNKCLQRCNTFVHRGPGMMAVRETAPN